jgi:hypothetical protein
MLNFNFRNGISINYTGFHKMLRAERLHYPPSQKATGANQWMNAKRVALQSSSEAAYAKAGFAGTSEDAMAVKPWSFTHVFLKIILFLSLRNNGGIIGHSGAVEKVASRFQSENKIIRQLLLLLP